MKPNRTYTDIAIAQDFFISKEEAELLMTELTAEGSLERIVGGYKNTWRLK